jgi:acetylornithine deacetylase/succinyl-diaminopimelate desuccinylase-like protein
MTRMQPEIHRQPIDTEAAINYAKNNSRQHLNELKAFLRIQSISTLPENRADIDEAAAWLANKLESIGMDNVEIISTNGHPLLYADWLRYGDEAPTLLLYGHYDVQPVDPLDLWDRPPFEPEEEGDYLYARGVSDDKGQLHILIRGLESYLQGIGRLPLNIKVLLEGEEETDGESLAEYVPDNVKRLKADAALISDTAMHGKNQPSIVYGLRGICYVLLDLVGPARDLHSGSYGGAIDNPLNVLGHIIAKLKDEEGRILIPGFYDNVRALNPEERRFHERVPVDQQAWLKQTGASKLWGEPGYSLIERIGTRPTLDVNGIIGGYTAPGTKTVLPSNAHAKISMRLVPDQDPHEIFRLFQDYLGIIAPSTVNVSCTLANAGVPSVVNFNTTAMRAANSALEAVFTRKPIFSREGGSIPIVGLFEEHLSLNTVLMGFGLPDDRIHSPNERFFIPNFFLGTETVIRFFDLYAKAHQNEARIT